MNRPTTPLKRTVLTLAVILALTPGALAQDFDIDWYTIDGGGEMFTTGGEFELSGTIGQPDANTTVMTGGDFELAGGFWSGITPEAEHPCPGDLDGDWDVDLNDLAQLIGHYGMTSGAVYEDGDLDGDGDVDLNDLAEMNGLYGTVCIPCPGDLDGDNDVDLSDLAQLVGNYGMTSGAVYTDGDLDLDGDVDLTDLAELLGLYGTTCE